MSIKLNDSVLWSKISWEMSFEKTIIVDDILPEIGVVYPVVFDCDYTPSKTGELHVLWKPPHSELNGWSDKRPSEILSSFVINGELRYRTGSTTEYEFFVSKRTGLIELFEQIGEDKISPFSKHKLPDGRSALYWENLDYISKTPVDKYIYLSASGNVGVKLEAILSSESGGIRLHFSSLWHEYFAEEPVITKYMLNSKEKIVFERILRSADVFVDHSYDDLPKNRVYGAEYW